ncbi:MAG TPA: hypothetical protein PKA98_11765 [Acidimicrobiales bacterium]|nr:hypothetical protein [Acidimicrobiales bacterium]
MVTVIAGRQPAPTVSDVSEVELTKLRGATVVVVVGAVVVVVGGAVVVVGGAVVVVVGGTVVVVDVVTLTEVVLDDPPGMDVPVGPLPSIVGSEPMRLLVSS